MTKAKLAFVHCRLGCLSCRPVRFFPRLFPFACLLLFACRRFRCPALGLAGFFPRRIFRYRLSVFFYRLFLPAVRFAFFPVFSLLPVRCCSPVVVFAVRHWDLPAFPRGGFFAIVLLSFPSRRPVRFFPSFSFCRSVVVRLSSFSLSGIGTCRLFPAADFSPSSYCLSLPVVRFVSFRLFPFACPLLFACRRFRCPAIGTCRLFPAADFSPAAYCLFLPVVRFAFFRLFPFAGISLPCLPFPSSLFVSDLSFLFFSSLFSPFCFFVFTGKRQAAVRPADMAAVWR